MPIKIEQITKTGLVVSDFDAILKPSEIKQLLLRQQYLEIKSNKNPYIAKYKGKDIILYVKNITYLGRKKDKSGNYDDWEHYKKRIQIGKNFKPISKQENTLLLGVYHYDNDNIFCIFDKKSYENSSANNASAHISTIDICKAKELGVFKKTDIKNNKLTVFTEENFAKVFDEFLLNKHIDIDNEINVFQEFSKTLNTTWLGVDCYDEMRQNHCNNAKQGEWTGFYLEYKFEQFLNQNHSYKKYCQYIQKKSKNEIDLDLWFEQGQFLGDLKAHTNNIKDKDINKTDLKGDEADLIGNDEFNAYQAVKLYGKIWYVAFNHSTKKDKDNGAKVMKKWNEIRCKDSMGYLSRMKYSIQLKSFDILEINKTNIKYLKAFNQGKNSNGKPRPRKILIDKADLKNDNFAIYRQKL